MPVGQTDVCNNLMAHSKIAPAKINLCLHVGPLRADGLHELASLAVFPAIGDEIRVTAGASLVLDVTGPFAPALSGVAPEDNLVMRAASLFQQHTGITRGANIVLTKNLPPASGMGGGTSDAATVLVLLRKLWAVTIEDADLLALAFTLGADGPLCLAPHLSGSNAAAATGAGETVSAIPPITGHGICLVNPKVEVPTGQVFTAFDSGNPAPALPSLPEWTDVDTFSRTSRNDLQEHAVALRPEIAAVLAELSAQSGATMARMSGSGATCFALFDTPDAAIAAADAARLRGWWAEAAEL